MLGPLTIEEFRKFDKLISKQFGLHFDVNRLYLLEKPLKSRIQDLGLSSYHQYLERIQHSKEAQPELLKLVQLLTIGETYFFRNRNHFKALQRYIIPQLTQKKSHINILSAGCSSGEEPFSLVLLCKRHFPHLNIRVQATDINRAGFTHAQRGLYSERSVRNVNPDDLKHFFHPRGNQFQLSSEIIQSVQFIEGNLNDKTLFRSMSDIDLIICRNVLIYFSREAIANVVSSFREVLSPQGFLLLGHSEKLRGITDEFETMEKEEAFFYQIKKERPRSSF